uniref:PSI domain-containing protein n=1 Tax=Chlamydomonas euryale TaxID=1486919 RepID=A0A7R9YWN5_9CHLO
MAAAAAAALLASPLPRASAQTIPDFSNIAECDAIPCVVQVVGEPQAIAVYECGSCDQSCYDASSCSKTCGAWSPVSNTTDIGGETVDTTSIVPADQSVCTAWICIQTPQLWKDFGAQNGLKLGNNLAICTAEGATAATIVVVSPVLMFASLAVAAVALLIMR